MTPAKARPWLLAFACAWIVVALFAARPAMTPGPRVRDFEAYWSAGATWNAHADPYGRAIWNAERTITGVNPARDEVLPFVGPPATLLAWSVLARLPYAVAARVWWTILVLALFALIALTIRGSGARITAFSFLAALALAVGYGPVTSDLALGQIALLAFLGAVAVVAPCQGAFGAFVAFLQPNVALGLASQFGRNRATLAMVTGALATYLAGAIASGWAWPVAYARIVAAHGTAERFTAIQLSPAAIAYGLGASPAFATVAAAIVAALAIVAAIFLWLRLHDSFARFAAFAALTPFVAGFFHEHDLIVAYVAALWCALRTHGTTRAIALAGTMLTAVDWLGLAQRPTGIAQSALLATAALVAFIVLDEAFDPRRCLLAAVPLAALFALAARLATTHVVPVWPDMLGNFHTPISASIAAVWLDEQRTNGLLAVAPAWALLRSLSLLGCALLAYAIYRHSSYYRTASMRRDASP